MATWISWLAGVALVASDVVIPARIPFTTPLERYGFELIREEGGVRAYKHPAADMIRIAAEGRFEAPPAAVEQVLSDYAAQLGVVSRLSEAEILDRGPQWLLVYQRLNLPVISDRDYVLYVRWGTEGDTLWITHTAIAGTGPAPKDGVVRVVSHVGSWQLKPVDGGSATFARFEAELDLGGLLPMWMARARAGEELPAMFSEMARLIKATGSGSSPCTSNCR